MSETSTRDQGKFIVRMPDGMREHIREAAEKAGRSMNAEIVYRLEAYDWMYEQISHMWAEHNHARDLTMNTLFDNMLRVYVQMTPEERQILEERADKIENAKELNLTSDDIRELVEKQRIFPTRKGPREVAFIKRMDEQD